MLSDSCREHRSHEHRNIRLEAAGVSHGAVLHRLPYSGGIRNGRPYYADGKPAYPSGVAGYHRRCVSLCRRPEQRPGRCFFGWFSHYNARLAADAAALALAKDIPVVHSYGLLLATFVIASCYHALCAHFVRAKGNTALFAVQGLFNTALFIGLNILFLSVFNWGIRGYVLSTTVANVITTVFLVWKERLWRYLRFERKRDLQRSMLRYCIPLIPAAIFWWIMGVSDRYMVNWFLGSDANGIYAVAYKIPTILTILAAVFMDAWQLSAIAERPALKKLGAAPFALLGIAIANGPAGLSTPLPPLDLASFQIPAFLLGVVILFGLELLKKAMQHGAQRTSVVKL